MLGNISPLFIGFFAFLFLSYRHLIQPIVITGAVGLISLATWLLIEPFVLFTRWLLIPLGLLAVPLGASLVATEHALHHTRIARYLMRSAVLLVLLFLLFQSRDVVYAIRYIASIDSRAMQYGSVPHFGYDVAAWLNAHVQPRQRVALKDYKGHLYFVNSDIILNSESGEELQWLWEHRASGAWQKYPYNRTYGIIRAKNGSGLPQGCAYAPYRFPQGAVDDTTTNLSGADSTTSDQSPASGATCQDSVGAGDGRQ